MAMRILYTALFMVIMLAVLFACFLPLGDPLWFFYSLPVVGIVLAYGEDITDFFDRNLWL